MYTDLAKKSCSGGEWWRCVWEKTQIPQAFPCWAASSSPEGTPSQGMPHQCLLCPTSQHKQGRHAKTQTGLHAVDTPYKRNVWRTYLQHINLTKPWKIFKNGKALFQRVQMKKWGRLKSSVPYETKLDVDPRRDDDASPMSSYRCMLRPTWMFMDRMIAPINVHSIS